MRTKIFCFFILLVSFSCQIDLPEEPLFLPSENDAAILNSATYVSHNATELVFETELVVLNSFYRGFDNDYLTKENLNLEGEGAYTIETFSFSSREAPENSSVAILLIDQSGSYAGIDPYNTRSQSINKFLEDIRPPHMFLMGASARQGKLSQEPVEFSTHAPGNNLELNSRYLFELSKRTGGSNSMFEAATLAIEKLIASGPSARKELILLIHTDNEEGITASENLTALAKANNITIHVIALGSDVDTDVLSTLATDTGGLFVVCPGEKELTKVFNELERLINGTRGVYKMRITYKPSQGTIQPGSATLHTIEILDPYTELNYNPVFITVKIPS